MSLAAIQLLHRPRQWLSPHTPLLCRPFSHSATDSSPHHLADMYNHNRALYNKSVSQLRKTYFAELHAQREREAELAALEQAQLQRAALERRRIKAMRVARNAQLQRDRREARRVQWERELAITQVEREKKRELYQVAKQRIVDQLEAECHLWLTTEEEVQTALGNPVASQKLWARPGSIIGAPSGSQTGFGDDGEFWRYECHTMDSKPTFQSPKDVMLERLEELAYLQANTSPTYWTDDRIEKAERKEQRARLRAIVREEGRRALLEKQRLMMRDIYGDSNNQQEKNGVKLPPVAMPAPKMDYIADYEAQEREGVLILKKDPRKFFFFEADLPNSSNLQGMHQAIPSSGDNVQEEERTDDMASSPSSTLSITASLGRPVALRNPFFNDRPTAFPLQLGRDLPKDTRTEKEKKRDERQERMRAAAEEAALAEERGIAAEVSMAAEEDLEDGSAEVDYDLAEEDAEKDLWASHMQEWSDIDKRLFHLTPPCYRLTNDEVDWIQEQLETKVNRMQERIDFEDKIRRQELKASNANDSAKKTIESLNDVDRYVMQDLGYDMDMMEALVKDLTPEQSLALEEINFTGRVGITEEEMAQEVRKVPGLTDTQVQLLVQVEMSILRDNALKNITKMG